MKLTDGKKIRNFTLLLTCMYMVSYITRINYGAVISEIATDVGGKDLASLAVTGSFVTYGAGQLISGYMGDKIQARYLVFAGFLLTIAMNFTVSFLSNPIIMAVVWSVNGFAQAFMWPPVVKLMTELLDGNNYKKSMVVVSYGASFGTMAAYFISSLCVGVSSWRAMFVTTAVLGAVMAIIWIRYCPLIDMKSTDNVASQATDEPKVKLGFPFIILAAMLIIVLQGSLRDGVQTWMPEFIKNSFNLEGFLAILLTGLALPLFSILSMRVTSKLYQSKITNEFLCAGTMLGIGMVSSLALFACNGFNPVVSTLFGAILTGSMHGVNMIMVCMVPACFSKYGRISLISGILNASTYVGRALSTYGIAKFSENFGWNSTILLWAGIAFTGFAICVIFAKSWKKFLRQ